MAVLVGGAKRKRQCRQKHTLLPVVRELEGNLLGDAVPQPPCKGNDPLDPHLRSPFRFAEKWTLMGGSKGIMPLAEGVGGAEPHQ